MVDEIDLDKPSLKMNEIGKHVFNLCFCQDEEWWMKLTWTNQV